MLERGKVKFDETRPALAHFVILAISPRRVPFRPGAHNDIKLYLDARLDFGTSLKNGRLADGTNLDSFRVRGAYRHILAEPGASGVTTASRSIVDSVLPWSRLQAMA